MAEEPTGTQVEYRLRWEGVEDVPVSLTNQFIGQVGQQNEIVLTFGQVTIPALIGSPEQQAEQAREISRIPIKPLVRLTLTRTALDELIGILEQTRINHDNAQQMRQGSENDRA
jgi:hypothetical protein